MSRKPPLSTHVEEDHSGDSHPPAAATETLTPTSQATAPPTPAAPPRSTGPPGSIVSSHSASPRSFPTSPKVFPNLGGSGSLPQRAASHHRTQPNAAPGTGANPPAYQAGGALSRTSSRRSEGISSAASPIMSPADSEAASEASYDGGTSSRGQAGGTGSGFISRHPSFSYHGLEGKGSGGNTIDKPDYSEQKIVVAMVGLPARGKSYLSNKLQRYLRWLEFEVKVFNVGQLRRKTYSERAKLLGKKDDQSANFFDPLNKSAAEKREAMASECLESLITWLKEGGNVGIHDATNSSRARRRKIVKRLAREKGFKLIFLESICTDPAVIEANIAVKVASGDPDYHGMSREDAERDFRARIRHYEESYETIDPEKESNLTYCKVVNVGYEVTCNKIDGYLSSRIAFYLMNLHVTPRSIFLTRHGESQFNVDGQIGGDSYLSPRGEMYAAALPQLVEEAAGGDVPLTVWTSTLKRTIQTAAGLPYPKLTWKSLDELDAGVCDGMTYEEIEEHYPEDYAARDDDKFNYRYRGGESYRDVVVRLEPVIMELERQENILIVCHQAVLRCLYAYFHNLSQEELPYIKIPLHTVIKLTPRAFGCEESRRVAPIEAVDTTRPKPVKGPTTPKSPVDDGVSPSTRPPNGRRPFYV